jgi:hypothetical protein
MPRALRESTQGGNIAARLYADWPTKFLDGVDRFFGDASMAERTLFPRAFGLKKPAPLWTAPGVGALVRWVFPRCFAGHVERVVAVRTGVDAGAVGQAAALGASGQCGRCLVGLVGVRLVRISISSEYSQRRTNCDSSE